MLAGGNLVMAVFHLDPHFLEGKNGFSSQVTAPIQGGSVKISPLINDLHGRVVFKIEIFQLRSNIIGIAVFFRLGQDASQHIPGVSFIGTTIRLQNVAEHPGNRSVFGSPGEELEGGGIGFGDHVALFNPGKPLNRRAIKPHSLCQGLFQLRWSDGKTF